MKEQIVEVNAILQTFGLMLDDFTDPKTQARAAVYLNAEILRGVLESLTGCPCSLLVPSNQQLYRWYVLDPGGFEYELDGGQLQEAVMALLHSPGPAAWAHLAAARGFRIVPAR